MASKAMNAKLNHLHESALLLAVTSPATSAFLGSQYLKVADHTDLESRSSDSRNQGFCSACGNILIPGWSCQIIQQVAGHSKVRKSAEKRAGTTASAANSISKTTVYQCLRCNSKIRQSVQKSAKPRSAPTKSAQVQMVLTPSSDLGTSSGTSAPATPQPQATGPPVSAAVNASSKKRARARKQGGLQAMLAKSKTETATSSAGAGFGLDLMDFMKTT